LEALFRADLAELLPEATASPPPLAAWPHPSPELGTNGFAVDRGLAQGRLAWAARLHPRVRAVYAELHGCAPEALCTSTDVVFYTPQSATPTEVSNRLWPHVDQNVHSEQMADVPVFQGALYVWPSSAPGASTTVVWSDSKDVPYAQLMADANIAATGRMGAHYSQVSAMRDKASSSSLLAGFIAGARRVRVPAGGLLLWSSRTMHQGHSGGARLAVPVCWEPAERRSAAARLRKGRLVASGLPSTHWASLAYQHELADTAPRAAPCGGPGGAPLRAQINCAAVRAGRVGDAAAARERIFSDAENMFLSVDEDTVFCESLFDLFTPEVAHSL
jgi:hypothetical protein